VKQAVILAAGRGSRMGSLTANDPKCLVKIHHQSILYRQLLHLQHAGIKDVIVVTGYKHEQVLNAITEWNSSMNIITLYNQHWNIANNITSLALTHSLLQKDFMLLEGDICLFGPLPQALCHQTAALLGRFEKHMSGTTVNLLPSGMIREFCLNPQSASWPGGYKTSNVYSFTNAMYQKAVLPQVEALLQSGNHHSFYEKAIAIALEQGLLQMNGVVISNHDWDEIDRVEDLMRIANRS
jgi:NDP-sugar pyrophosphorylase family protein